MEKPAESSADYASSYSSSSSLSEESPAAAPVTADSQPSLNSDLDRARLRLRGWAWAGLLPLSLGLGLWLWGPREREMQPVLTQDYTFHQAGLLRGQGDTTWVWVLADSAQHAQVLLSADQGHTWRVRDLHLPLSRARALALGWGTPGRGLLVGDSGRVRVLADVLRHPRQGEDSRTSSNPQQALFAVAVDSAGQQAVVLGRAEAVQVTGDSSRSWYNPRPRIPRRATGVKPALVNSMGKYTFFLSATDTLYLLAPSFSANYRGKLTAPKDSVHEARVANPFTVAPISLNLRSVSNNENDYWIAIAADGSAQYLLDQFNVGKALPIQLFDNLPPQPLTAVVIEQAGQDSTLLFFNTPTGGQLRRVGISARLAAFAKAHPASKEPVVDARLSVPTDSTVAPNPAAQVSRPQARGTTAPRRAAPDESQAKR